MASYRNGWDPGHCLAQLLARMIALNFIRNVSLVSAGQHMGTG